MDDRGSIFLTPHVQRVQISAYALHYTTSDSLEPLKLSLSPAERPLSDTYKTVFIERAERTLYPFCTSSVLHVRLH